MKLHIPLIMFAMTLGPVCGVATARPEASFPAIDATPLGGVSPGAMILHDGWQLQDAPRVPGGEVISKPGYPATDWYHTTVPTTVLGALIRNGIYPDPYVGTNNMAIPDTSDEHNRRFKLQRFSHLPDKANPWTRPWWYRTEFKVPSGYAGRTAWLHLDGLNYRAEVWVNGLRVASSNELVGMYQRFTLDVTSAIHPGELNVVAVRIQGPDHPGDPLREALGGFWGDFNFPGGDGVIFKDVTSSATLGWCCVPAARDRNMGLWQHVWLEATGPVAVRDPAAFTDVKLPGGEEAGVTVRGFLETSADKAQEVEVLARLAPDGFEGATTEIRKTVRVTGKGKQEIVISPKEFPELVMKHPRLWWPVTYGEQPLYRLTMETRVNGRLSGTASSRFGVRTVGTVILPSGGRAWTVNGRVIRMSGGASMADFLLTWNAQRYRDEVRLMAEAHFTLARMHGSGIILPEVFLDECDRRGVLVWQDLVRTSPTGAIPDDAAPIYLANMRDAICRLRGHPSLLFWCGSNELIPSENIGRALEAEILPALDGTRPWLPSSHNEAPWSKVEVRTYSFGPYSTQRPALYFQHYASVGGFNSKNEIGMASVPPINTVARFIPGYESADPATFPFNQALGYHDATSGEFRWLDSYIRTDLGDPATLAEYLWAGDLYNSACYRAIFEAANKARPRNAGTFLWKANACWPGFQWQLFDWSLRPNAGYYSARSACQPLHVQASLDDFTIQVASTLAMPRPKLTVRAQVVSLSGTVEAGQAYALEAAADATTKVGPLPEVARDGHAHVVALDLLDQEGSRLDRTVLWMQKNCRWQELMAMEPTVVSAKVLGRQSVGDETLYRVRLVNRGAIPALQVWVELLGGPQGFEILPSFWSENALTLLPGETRDLAVRCRSRQLKGLHPRLMVEGWNVRPLEVAPGMWPTRPLALEVSGAAMEQGDVLRFTAVQSSEAGPRLTTWPIPVRVDGKVSRVVRVALRNGVPQEVRAKLALSAGPHRIEVGEVPGGRIQTESPAPLWTIGQRDGGSRDLAYGPDGFEKAPLEAQFTVGVSEPAKDWPYIQAGPKAAWTKGRPNRFTVIFHLDQQVVGAAGWLKLHLLGTTWNQPALLNVEIGGFRQVLRLPQSGNSEAHRRPNPEDRLEQQVMIPSSALKAGENQLRITVEKGSWVVYDALEFCLDRRPAYE